jgi:hypothetical protein
MQLTNYSPFYRSGTYIKPKGDITPLVVDIGTEGTFQGKNLNLRSSFMGINFQTTLGGGRHPGTIYWTTSASLTKWFMGSDIPNTTLHNFGLYDDENNYYVYYVGDNKDFGLGSVTVTGGNVTAADIWIKDNGRVAINNATTTLAQFNVLSPGSGIAAIYGNGGTGANTGIYGFSDSGQAIRGLSNSGIGGYFDGGTGAGLVVVGNAGIGTSTPGARLEISEGGTTNCLRIGNAGTGFDISANNWLVRQSGQSNFSSIGIGIGTSIPTYPFSLECASANIYGASIENSDADGWGLEIRTNSNSDTKRALDIYNISTGTVDFGITTSGKILVGTDIIDSSAILKIESTTQGILPPRLTTAERNAIGSPATGLMIYNTDNLRIEAYNGTTWESGEGDTLSEILANGNTTGGNNLIISAGDYIQMGSAAIGGIYFTGTSDYVVQDDSNLHWDITNSNLGIGTNTTNVNWKVDIVPGGKAGLRAITTDNKTGLLGASETGVGVSGSGNSGTTAVGGYFTTGGTTANSHGVEGIASSSGTAGYFDSASGYGIYVNSGQSHFNDGITLVDETLGTDCILAVNGTTKGVKLPRLTTAQETAIGTPSEGLMVYNTDLNELRRYDTAWDVVPGPTSRNYAYAYDTTTQTTVAIDTFQDVTFNTNVVLDGWTHTAGTAVFTCAQTGIYSIEYFAHTQKTGGGGRNTELRIVLDGTEVAGSQTYERIDTDNNIIQISRDIILSVTSGQVVKVQFAGGDNIELSPPAGISTTDISASVRFIRIK